MGHHFWLARWLVLFARAGNALCLPGLASGIEPLAVALFALRERRVDPHFEEGWRKLPGSLAKCTAMSGGRDDHDQALRRQQRSQASQGLVEIRSLRGRIARRRHEARAHAIAVEQACGDIPLTQLAL